MATDQALVHQGSQLLENVQLALDRGILQAYFSLEQGPFDLQPTLKARVKANDPTTRAWLAYALHNYRARFEAGS